LSAAATYTALPLICKDELQLTRDSVTQYHVFESISSIFSFNEVAALVEKIARAASHRVRVKMALRRKNATAEKKLQNGNATHRPCMYASWLSDPRA